MLLTTTQHCAARFSTASLAAAAATSQRCLLQQLQACFLSPHRPPGARLFATQRTGRRPSAAAAPAAAAAAAPTGPLEQQQPSVQQQQQQQQQQQTPQQPGAVQQPQQQQLDSSVQETLKLLESSIGALSTQPMVPPPQPRVFVISGPSGVGKDAVLKHLQQRRPDLHFVVTATSRGMRPGEVEGKDYFFVTAAQFEAWIAAGDALLEHAVVYGEFKGIPRGQVDAALARGADVVLRIDVQGAATVRRLLPGVVSVFLVAESEAQLVSRLVSRKTEPLDKMTMRVSTARQECGQLSDFDYVVVNREGRLEECVDSLCAIIDAERLKTRQQQQQQQQGSNS